LNFGSKSSSQYLHHSRCIFRAKVAKNRLQIAFLAMPLRPYRICPFEYFKKIGSFLLQTINTLKPILRIMGADF